MESCACFLRQFGNYTMQSRSEFVNTLVEGIGSIFTTNRRVGRTNNNQFVGRHFENFVGRGNESAITPLWI